MLPLIAMHGHFDGEHFSNVYGFRKRDGTSTSVRLEPQVVKALHYLAFREGISVQEVVRRIGATPRPYNQGFSSAIRCYVIRQLMQEVLDLSAPNPKRKR
jgi:predicted DNA-binding ribbon-helix-helix protein